MNTRRIALLLSASFALTACGGDGGGGSTAPVPGGGGSSNSAPRVTSPTSFTFAENEPVVFDVVLEDADGDDVVLTVDATNEDGSVFIINSAVGDVAANTEGNLLDFERPLDQNRDNVYTQTYTLSDGTVTVSGRFSVTITNVDEDPVCVSGQTVDVEENTTGIIYQVLGGDPEGEPGEFILEDIALPPEVRGKLVIDADSGEVQLTEPLDFEDIGEEDIRVRPQLKVGDFFADCSFVINVTDKPASVESGLKILGTQTSAMEMGSVLADLDGDVWIRNDGGDIADTDGFAYLVSAGQIIAPLGAIGGATIDLATEDKRAFTADFTSDSGAQFEYVLKAAPLGPMDGDQFDEFIIVQPTENAAGDKVAATFIKGFDLAVGSSGGNINLSDLPDNLGLSLISSEALTLGSSASIATGDLNGDGVQDIILGLPGYELPFGSTIDNWSSRTYVISGQALLDAQTDVFDLDTQAASNVMVFSDRNNDMTDGGEDVAILPDVTGDGLDEIIITDGDELVVWQGSDLFKEPVNGPYHDYKQTPPSTGIVLIKGDFGITLLDGQADLDNDGKGDILFGQSNGSGVYIAGADLVFSTDINDRQNIHTNSETDLRSTEFSLGETQFDARVDVLSDANGDGVDDILLTRPQTLTGVSIISGTAIAAATTRTIDFADNTTGDALTLVNSPFPFSSGSAVTVDYNAAFDGTARGTEEIYLPLLTDGVATGANFSGEPQAYLLRGSDVRQAFTDGESELDIKALFNAE